MDAGFDRTRDAVTLVARLLTAGLFLVFGWDKLLQPVATAGHFAQTGVPFPALACAVAIAAELGGGVALVLGLVTRPLVVLLAAYTLATAFIGHPFWTMTGPAYLGSEINFLKNVSICGGLLALFVTGAGRYSADQAIRQARTRHR